MKLKSFMKGVIVLAVVMAMAACTSGGGQNADPNSGADANAYVPAGDMTSYKIGTFGPTTGDYKVYGLAVTNAVILAVEDWNAEHGTNISVVVEDTQGDSAQAMNVFNKFTTSDMVAAIIGGTLSGESTTVAQATQDSIRIPMCSPSATAAAFTDTTDINVFRACYTDPQQAALVADFAVDTLGATKAAIIYNGDDDYSVGLEASFKAEFESKGGTVVASEVFATEDTDYTTQLTKIAANDIDVLFIPNYYEADTRIASQARQVGIDAQLLGCDGWDGVLSVANDADMQALEGAIFINQYSPDMESVQDIMTRYKAKFGEDINSFGINSYDATMMMLEAIESAGELNIDKINAAVASANHSGILGQLSFDANGDPIKTPVYVTIKGGAYVSYK